MSHAYYARLYPNRGLKPSGTFAQAISNACAARRPASSMCQNPSSPRHPLRISFPCFFCFLLSTIVFFSSLRRGGRIEVEDLIRVADKVTTILSNASSDRIHIRTLIGIAQLFYGFRETVAPTNSLLLGLP